MELIPNKSKTYLPYYINQYIPIKYVSNLLNTYIAYEDEYYYWCMLYKFSGKSEFTKYERELEKSSYFKKLVDVSKDKVLYVFDIPDELNDIINLFINGKYSQLPDKQNLIKYLNSVYRVPLTHDIIKVLKKCPTLKEKLENNLDVKLEDYHELSSIPNINNETFKLYKLNEKQK